MQLTLKDKAGNTLAETVYFFRKTKDLLLPEDNRFLQDETEKTACVN